MLFDLQFSEDNPLFCVAFHPSKPEFVIGLANGEVKYYEYPKSIPVEKWSTKRHKGSCRGLVYDHKEDIYSIGSDKIVKKFSASTGKVLVKTKLSNSGTCITANEEYIAIGDEEGGVTILKYDLTLHRKYDLPEIDSVNAIQPLTTAINKHNFAVAADTFLFRLDVRSDDIKSQSEDQEDEILSGCVPTGSLSAWGMSEGVLTVWKNQGLQDQQYRIKLSKLGSVDAVLSGEQSGTVIAGTSEGDIFEVDIVGSKILAKNNHSDEDVMFLDFDYEYKLVSGSTTLLKVWEYEEYKLKDQADKVEEVKSNKRTKKQKEKEKKGKKAKIVKGAIDTPFADLL